MNNLCNSGRTLYDDPVEKVLFTQGLLHYILTFLSPYDLLSVSLASSYFLKISRSDLLWKEQCIYVWRDKVGVPSLKNDNNIAPYWRSYLTLNAVENMSVKDLKSMFAERPLGRRQVRELFANCLEKEDTQQAILELMPRAGELGGETSGGIEDEQRGQIMIAFDRLWFGSFVSSIVDSRRSTIVLDELLSRKGFLMYFKLIHQDQDIVDRDPEISLQYNCKCLFDEEESGFAFRMEEWGWEEAEMHRPQNLTWKWVVPGKAVQVGFYPPLVIHRLLNWGWKLENKHVVLFSQ